MRSKHIFLPDRHYHLFWVSELQLIPKVQGNILLLSNVEVWSEYRKQNIESLRTKERDCLCYSLGNTIFPISLNLYGYSISQGYLFIPTKIAIWKYWTVFKFCFWYHTFELCIKRPEYCQLIVDPIAIGDGGEGAGAVGGI